MHLRLMHHNLGNVACSFGWQHVAVHGWQHVTFQPPPMCASPPCNGAPRLWLPQDLTQSGPQAGQLGGMHPRHLDTLPGPAGSSLQALLEAVPNLSLLETVDSEKLANKLDSTGGHR